MFSHINRHFARLSRYFTLVQLNPYISSLENSVKFGANFRPLLNRASQFKNKQNRALQYYVPSYTCIVPAIVEPSCQDKSWLSDRASSRKNKISKLAQNVTRPTPGSSIYDEEIDVFNELAHTYNTYSFFDASIGCYYVQIYI